MGMTASCGEADSDGSSSRRPGVAGSGRRHRLRRRGDGRANAPAATRKAGAPRAGRSPAPRSQAVKAGAKPAGPRAHARTRVGTTLPVIRAARVSARTPGLAAFYAGLEKALAKDTTSVVDGGTTPQFAWPAAAADGGVLSRNGALALAIALFALALLLAFSLLPRLAAIGFLPVSRTIA